MGKSDRMSLREKTPLMIESDRDGSDPNLHGSSGVTLKSKRMVMCTILSMELCERLTYYSIYGNMVLFCTNMLMYGSGAAVTISLIFQGTAYFIPFFGGMVADSVAGKFNTIFASGLIYLVGTWILPVTAFNFAGLGRDSANNLMDLSVNARRGFFLTAIGLIAIGTGGIKSNVAPFGAEQLEGFGPKALQSFFNWFYWFINVGSSIAQTAVVYVQQEIGFDIGFLIPAVSMLLGLIVFLVGKRWYIHKPIQGSTVKMAGKIFAEGVRRRRYAFKDQNCLDLAKTSNGGSFRTDEVEGVKTVCRMMPVMASIIYYSTIYSQSSSTFLVQAVRMNLKVGGFTLPAASLNLFDGLTILLLVPLMDRVVYPLLRKCNRYPSQLQRIGFGLIIGALCVVVAGVVEILRKNDLRETGGFIQIVGGAEYRASNISILWQAFQFLLLGVSEVFTNVAAQEFAYSQSPPNMKGMVMGIYLATVGIGSYFGSALVNIVNAATQPRPWFPDEINEGHVEYFFFLMAGLAVVNFGVFVFVARWYKPCRPTVPFGPEEDEPVSSFNEPLLSSQEKISYGATQGQH